MTLEEKEYVKTIDESLANLYDIVKELKETVDNIANPMIYNYVDDNMPEWAHEAVQTAIDKGIVNGTGNGLGLTYSDLRTIVREYRSGLYDR